MNTGTTISGIGHGLLIGWLLFGGLLSARDPEPVAVTDVSIISGEEFAALTQPAAAPSTVVEAPEVPPPAAEDPVVPTPAPETVPETPDAPPPTDLTPPDDSPDLTDLAPLPEAEVADEAPVLPTPPAHEESTNLVPDVAAPRPAPRVAPEAAPAPEPDVAIADEATQSAQPAPDAETPQPPEPETAPEEATTETVTEAEETETVGLAPPTSVRPTARPARPRPAAPAQPVAAPEPDSSDAINDALRQALTDGAGTAPTGPPLTRGEKDALRVAVGKCWNVGSLSSDALNTTIVLAVQMAQDGKPQNGTIRMVSFSGGSEAAARQTFESARRAVIRCGARGFDLPGEKYEQWRDIEMTFNPEKMRIK